MSADQLVSPAPGFIAQMTGHLTVERHKHATVFVDQATHFSHVHFQKGQSAEETLEAKDAFECCSNSVGVKIKACHADSGMFMSHKWVNACVAARQTLTFAGVDAHHQNGVTE